MEWPQGISDIRKDDTIKILKKLGFIGRDVYQCLYIKKSVKGVYVALYVDDYLMVGNKKAIDDAISALKENGLVLNIKEGLQDYLSCEIKFSTDKKKSWLGQPHLTKTLDKKFGECVKNICSHKTQGMLKFLIVRPAKES